MTTEAFDTLQFLLAQVAAESYLDGYGLELIFKQGANHYDNYQALSDAGKLGMTQATSLMWGDFNATWEIVAHQENTASGFSGTLLKNKVDGKYTAQPPANHSRSNICCYPTTGNPYHWRNSHTSTGANADCS